MSETLFYVFGIALAVSAVVFSFLGLKMKGFPGKAMPLVIAWFLILAAGATTYAVIHAQHEKEHKEHELEHANEVIEGEEEQQHEEKAEEGSEETGGETGGGENAGGAGGTLEVVADESELAYEEESLEAEAGKVEIDFENPSPIGHDVAVELDGEQLGATEVITEGKDSTTIDLEPGDYVFYCTVPGHREAGMEGPLTVR